MSISPNVPSPQDSYHYENSGTPRWIAVLFGVLFVVACGSPNATIDARPPQQDAPPGMGQLGDDCAQHSAPEREWSGVSFRRCTD